MNTIYTFFFTEAWPFSQWYRCAFAEGAHAFNCAEQYMMYGKALLFEDPEVAAEILAADHPRKHKALGRKVRRFDAAIWNRERERIVRAGNHAKFTQNPELRELPVAAPELAAPIAVDPGDHVVVVLRGGASIVRRTVGIGRGRPVTGPRP